MSYYGELCMAMNSNGLHEVRRRETPATKHRLDQIHQYILKISIETGIEHHHGKF